MNKPHVISSKPVFHASLFDVFEKEIRLPTGKKVIHHNVERHPTVLVLPITDNDEIYLIKEYRYILGETILEAMAGFINPEENVLVAAKRELKEETGIVAMQWEKLITLELASSVIHSKTHIFLARELEIGIAEPEEDEIIEVVKMSLTDAVSKVMQGEIKSSSTVVAILMLNQLRNGKKK